MMNRERTLLLVFACCLFVFLVLDVVPATASSSSSWRLDWYHSHDDDDDDHLDEGAVYDVLKVFDKIYKKLRKGICCLYVSFRM